MLVIEAFQSYPLQYIPFKYRFYEFPVLEINLISGRANLINKNKTVELNLKNKLTINSTHPSKIYSLSKSTFKIRIGKY